MNTLARACLSGLSAAALLGAAHAGAHDLGPAVNGRDYVEPGHRHGALRMAAENRHAWTMERRAAREAALAAARSQATAMRLDSVAARPATAMR